MNKQVLSPRNAQRRIMLNDMYRTCDLAIQFLNELKQRIPVMLSAVEEEIPNENIIRQLFNDYTEHVNSYTPHINNILNFQIIKDTE